MYYWLTNMSRGVGVETLLCTWMLVALTSGDRTGTIAGSIKDDNSPQAVVISPSEYFEGNDGPWSTFDLRVGTPEQDVRVIVSTASPESFVVLSDYGCSTSVFETVPANCAVSRGKLFNPNESSSWHELGVFGINENGVGLEANLGYSQRSDFATEHFGLGLTGPSLDNQIVAGIATPEPFYLGLFGLNNQPVNFSSIGNSTTPAFITTLKDNGVIPSLSWSYTAGAKYRLKQVYGQLILSGYDTSRFEENSASFTMADDITRDLVVVLQSISYSGSTSTTLLSDPIDIFIDSTDPNLWLPDDVCDAFEMAFGLTLDNTTGLYLVNETYHNTLLNSDAEVTFRISDVNSGGEAVRIVLPYAAFDLTAEYPLVQNTSYYFPLKRAANSTQYTLGRTFLQEAYLTADYERHVFNVSACSWVAGAQENIVTIPPKGSDESPGGSSSNSGKSGGKSLSGGAIAGIVIGAVVGALLIVALIIFLTRRQRKKKAYAAHDPVTDMAVITGPVHNHPSQRTGKYYSPDTVGTSTDAGGSEDNRMTPGDSNNSESIAGGSTQQELDGEDTQVAQLSGTSGSGSRAESSRAEMKQPDNREPAPVYHELAGTEVPRTGPDAVPSSGGLVPHVEREEGDDHLDSPYVSTLGSSAGWQDKRADPDLVSPTSPVRHSFA
ncbi:acid protease [Xylaria cubensis]|nr:acid protease [Xylaria cubensis]